MPNISGHMAIAKRVSELLNIDSPEFYKGNLFPDLFSDKDKSHFKMKGKIYFIPNLERAKKELDLTNMLNIGALSHLLLDYYYFENYLPSKYDRDLFYHSKAVYRDYDALNKDIVKHFNLDVDYLTSILKDYDDDFLESKLETNIRCLKLNVDRDLEVLDKEDFIKFLEDISNTIANELKEYIKKI